LRNRRLCAARREGLQPTDSSSSSGADVAASSRWRRRDSHR
jgi:hypothetical protein